MVKYPDSDKTCRKAAMSSWIVLILAGICESVWATALGKSQGFTKIVPDIVFILGLILSMMGLAFAMRNIPTSTAYAVWVGIGAALTVLYAMATGPEPVSLARILLIIGLVACVVGLKVVN